MRKRLTVREYSQYKPIFMPVLVLLLISILSLTLGRFLFGRLLQVRADLQSEQKRAEILDDKLLTLQNLDQAALQSDVEMALLGIPSQSSTLFALSSLRQRALGQNLTIDNLGVTVKEQAEKGSKVRSIELRFDLQGGLFPTLAFLKQIKKSSPLVEISKIRFSVSGGLVFANLTINSFWGELPGKLGSVDEPIKLLSSEEENLLSGLRELEPPQTGKIVPSPPQGRENPFAF